MTNYNIPEGLKFTKTHEWVEKIADNTFKIGISEFAAKSIGDVTFVELPEIDSDVDKEDAICTIETVKSSEDIFNPIEGTVVAVNETLEDTPEIINSDSYDEGWLFEIKGSVEDFEALMSAKEYEKFLEEQEG
jgi:glycine cleavage system H protein